MKHMLRCVLINIACVLNVLAMLFILKQWLLINGNVLKIIIVSIFALGLLSTVIQIAVLVNFNCYTMVADVLYKVSFVVFLLCVVSSVSKISVLNIARGSPLYDKYAFPAALPLVASLLLFILKKK